MRENMKVILIILVLIIGKISTSSTEPPELTLVATSAGIHASWTPVIIPNCFNLYLVTHRIQGVHEYDRATENTYTTFPFTPCAEHTIVLQSICRTGIPGPDPVTESIVTGISDDLQVENLNLIHDGNSLKASWSRPEDAVICKEVEYHLTLSISDRFHTEITTGVNSHIFEVEAIPPCALVTLTVTPVDDRGSGASKAIFIVTDNGTDVGGIQDLIINNGRIEWSESQDNGYCKVAYRITIKSNGNEEEFLTTDLFFESDFVPCEIYNITVTSIVGDAVINTLNIDYKITPSNIGHVENVEIAEINGEVVVSWSPVVIGICEVYYDLRHYIDGVQEGGAHSAETHYQFPTYNCAENSIIIQIVVDTVVGDEIEATITSPSAEPDKVENFKVNLNDDSFGVRWDPVVVGRCAIEYLVEHITSHGIGTGRVTAPLVSITSIPCSHNEIRVTAIAGSSTGPSSSTFVDISVNDLPRVEDLTVTTVEEGLLVSWAPILKGHCNVVYSISNFDGEHNHEYQTELTSYTIWKTNCANNTVSIVGVEPNSRVTSPPNYYVVQVDIDLSKVTNLKVNQLSDGVLQINWDKPMYIGNCVIEYLVNLRVGDEDNSFETKTSNTSLEPLIDIKPCYDFEVSVTPISPEGRKGLTSSEINTAYLFRVQPVNDLVKQQGTLTWQRPNQAGICQLSYRVTVVDEKDAIIKEVETTETSVDFEMQPCRRYTSHVKVVDVLTNLISKTIVVEGVGAPRFIEDVASIEYEIDQSALKVSWNAAVAGDCLVIYDIVHIVDNQPVPFVTIENSIVLDTIACSTNNITITPVLQQDLVVGNPFTTSIFIGLDVLEAVENIAVDNNLLLWWTPPQHSGNCPLTYLVDVFDNTGLLIESIETKDIYVEWNFSACAQYLLRITPHHNDMAGIPTVVRFNAAEVAPSAPTHIKTVPSLFSAEITLQATPFVENTCAIKELRITCDESFGSEAHIDRSFPIEDNVERTFKIELTGLARDTFYRCKAQWSGALDSELSKIFEFVTVEITPTRVEVTDVTSNEITISWEIQWGETGRIISHFIVEVTTIGPNHFLQESCNVKRNFAENFTLPRYQETFTFTDALPNFRYQLSLIVVYTVGMDIRSQTTTVNTLPAVPGPITDLECRFEMENCAEYVGLSFFRWTLPCDINGELDRFIVYLKVFHNAIGTSRSDSVITTLRPNGNQHIFSVPIPILNPFFNYSISVTTEAAYRAIAPVELDAAPPRAYTYCPAVETF